MVGMASKGMGNYLLMLQFYDLALDCAEKVTGVGDSLLDLCSGFGMHLHECGETLLSNAYWRLGSMGSKLNRHRKSLFRNLNASNYFDLILEEEKNQIDYLSNKKNARDKGFLDSIKSWRSYCDDNAKEVNPLLEKHLGRIERLMTVSAGFHEGSEPERWKNASKLEKSIIVEDWKTKRKRIEEIEKKVREKMKSKDRKKRLDDLKGFFE